MEITKEPNWNEIKGMSEDRAERYMIENWGRIPERWNDPIFRCEILEQTGDTFISAHLSNFDNSYGGASRFGNYAQGIGYRRNVDGQGFPDEDEFLNNLES